MSFDPKKLNLNFVSQVGKARKFIDSFTISQINRTYGGEEIVIRGDIKYFSDAGMSPRNKVEILHDKKHNVWVIQPSKNKGLILQGKGSSTLFVRYKLKEGFHSIGSCNKIKIDKDNIFVDKGKIYLKAE